jgi:DNA-binding MarR family transcriptional regulator
VAVLETTKPSLSPRDRILWILANSGGKMERSELRQDMEMTYTDLDPILTKLEPEGKIRRSGEMTRL